MKTKDFDRFTQHFAEIVKKRRHARGLSHEKLALMSGVTRSTISNIEANRKSPTLATCYKVSKSLGIALSDLIRECE